MEFLLSPEIWGAFIMLPMLEIVLGIDNIIFITVLTDRLPDHQRARGRYLGLALAMGLRILLLLSIAWIMSLTTTVYEALGQDFSIRDFILLGGGVFLIFKATREIHNALEVEDEHDQGAHAASFIAVMIQIALIDVVFSLDSVITAIGLVQEVPVMIAAIVCAVLVMMLAANAVAEFVAAHPSIKMLALGFLVLIGFTLTVEGWGLHVPKGYLYSAMTFAFVVEILNIRASKRKPLRLRKVQLGDLMLVRKSA